jgi:SAM-dependent methyltransferase
MQGSADRLALVTLPHHSSTAGAAYSDAGDAYLAYADGDPQRIYAFGSRYAYGDRQVWSVIDAKLQALRGRGDSIRVLDAGCGPGTWLRRIAVRARTLGFRRIEARGFDVAEAQVVRARQLAAEFAAVPGVRIAFEVGDVTRPFARPGEPADLTLCLYAVLNHVATLSLPAAMRELARATSGYFITTVRASGSPPTIFIDGIEHAVRFRQDHSQELFDVELDDGRRMTFPARLFTASELRAAISPHLRVEQIRGLDLFHGRFAPDARWNPACLDEGDRFRQVLADLEQRYDTDPSFIDRAAHLLLVARAKPQMHVDHGRPLSAKR